MDDFNGVLARGILCHKETKLCIFEINDSELQWINVHADNIKGKFYKGCPAKLYRHDDILKAVIVKYDKKNNH